MFPWSVPADPQSITVQGTCETEQTGSSEGVKPHSSPESLGYFCPWKYSRVGYKGPWAVLFPGWKKSINFESRSNLDLGPALSEGLMRWPVSVLFNPWSCESRQGHQQSNFLFPCFYSPPWLSLALPFFLLKEDISLLSTMRKTLTSPSRSYNSRCIPIKTKGIPQSVHSWCYKSELI